MRVSHPPMHRRGAVAVEGALVYSSFFMIMLLLVVGGFGVFRYELLTTLASDAARYASVRGSGYAADNSTKSPNTTQIFDQAVAPMVIGIDTSKLTLVLEVVDTTTGKVVDWDSSTKAPYNQSKTGVIETNRVRATVTYQWFPELFIAGPYTMKAVSEMPLTN